MKATVIKRCRCVCEECDPLPPVEGLHPSTVNELLRLTLLAPDIIEQLRAGCQPRRLTLMWFQRHRLPVDESHLVRPIDVNGVNKAAGEYYHLLYNNAFGVRACSLRLTNVYGPRQLIQHNRQGFIGWFIRLAIEGREIEIYGDGGQLRDFVFVDDAADAFLRAGACDTCDGEVFNVGGGEPISHRDLVRMLLEVTGTGCVKHVPWPVDKQRIDIGSFYSDSSKFQAAAGWQPTIGLREGLERTVAFYRVNLPHYTGHA